MLNNSVKYERLGKSLDDKSLYEEILSLYDAILDRLIELEKSKIITAYEGSALYDALKAVFEALGKTSKAEKEAKSIMDGKILEFSADKNFDAGKAEGKVEGVAIGEAKGRMEGEQKLAKLLNVLIASGRNEDVACMASDQEYRTSFYEEHSIV